MLDSVTQELSNCSCHLLANVISTQVYTPDHRQGYQINDFALAVIGKTVILQDNRPNGW